MRGRFGTDITNHDRGELIFYQPFRYWDRYLPRRTGDEDADTFSGVHDHPEAAYLELGQHVRSAYWDRIGWKEDLEGAQGGETDPRRRGGSGETSTLDILVLARLNHNVPWDSNRIVDLRGQGQNSFRPTTSAFGANQAEDVLYVFDDPEAANRIGKESDNLEIRVYFVYRPGSFLPQDIPSLGGWDIQRFENTWKRTPWFKELDVEYTSRTTTLSRSFRR
jgi:hypothetical protein